MKVPETHIQKKILLIYVVFVVLSFIDAKPCISNSINSESLFIDDSVGVSYMVSGILIEEGVKRRKSDFFGFTIIAYEVVENEEGELFYKVNSDNQKVTTGKKGNFIFKLNSSKRYLIKCVKPGYTSDEVPLPKRNIASGQHISLEMMVRKAEAAILSGYIISEVDNEILKNAQVSLRNTDKGIVRTLITGKDGSYSFEMLEGARYKISVKKEMFFKSSPAEVSYALAEAGILRKNIALKSMGVGKIFRLSGFYFGVNEYTINKKQAVALQEAVEIINKNPEYQFEVACFTDARGDDEYNLDLTKARAQSIVNFLIENYDILPERLMPKGYGETRLLNECANGVYCSTEKHEQNRRIELRILKIAE